MIGLLGRTRDILLFTVYCRAFTSSFKNHIRFRLIFQSFRYLQNGNILAARTFINHFTSSFTSKYPSSISSDPSSLSIGTGDEIIVTSDSILNFSQVAVRLCQRAQGDKNKLMRESWVRFCGMYQSRGGVLAVKEIRKVGWFRCKLCEFRD